VFWAAAAKDQERGKRGKPGPGDVNDVAEGHPSEQSLVFCRQFEAVL
jgi:hypothetical protein